MKKKATYVLILAGGLLAACNADTDKGQEMASSTLNTPGSTPDPVRGAVLFATNCAACHGRDAMGTDRGPPLIHRIYEPSHHDDFSFYRAVSNGSRQHHWQFGDMPPVPGVSFADTGHIVAWVRQQQRKAGIE